MPDQIYETRPGMELVDAKGRLWTLEFVMHPKACLAPIEGHNDHKGTLDVHVQALQDLFLPIVDSSGDSGVHSPS